jgi:hypothetical protein
MRLWFALLALPALAQKPDLYNWPIRVPRLVDAARIDGDLADWRDRAHTDGVWDLERLRQTPWFDPARNRLTLHAGEGGIAEDLQARYYMAWDSRYLYLGAEVRDNVNDVADPAHQDKRWYFKDAICWFVEAPRLAAAKRFGEGDNAFCFVIDTSRPRYGAWWRHGAPGKTYIEEPLPASAAEYAIRRGPGGDFTLEARVAMAPTFGASTAQWKAPREGDVYGVEIVHTDPDGGGYGGHLLIYGRGDEDETWGWMVLAPPIEPLTRKPE